jgi:hypothetical protein
VYANFKLNFYENQTYYGCGVNHLYVAVFGCEGKSPICYTNFYAVASAAATSAGSSYRKSVQAPASQDAQVKWKNICTSAAASPGAATAAAKTITTKWNLIQITKALHNIGRAFYF